MPNSTLSIDKFTLLSKISHELKTPIHGISGLSNYLNDNWDELEEAQRKNCVANICEAGELLQNLVNKLFHLSSLNDNNFTFNFEKANIVEIINKTIEENKLFIVDNDSINIIYEGHTDEVYIVIDKFWLNQLLYNLISNAIKHSNAKNIVIKTHSHEDQLLISVNDDGIGIPQNELTTIFAPFKQSSNIRQSEKGSGLGLAICYEIVTAHGGKIWAKNNEDGGATIAFTLNRKNK